jgi:phosphatidylglycerophosphate synthase
MTEASLPQLLIIANAPQALTKIGGISLLERARRMAIALGFRETTILSPSIDAIATELARQTWRDKALSIQYRTTPAELVAVEDLRAVSAVRALLISADAFYDKRLVAALIRAGDTCGLIDSDPPPPIAALLQDAPRNSIGWLAGAAVISPQWLAGKDPTAAVFSELGADVAAGRVDVIDAAKEPSYIATMRREVRPCFFPAPPESMQAVAERFLINRTQKGVLDLPALVHAPIEKWLVAHLRRTSITPNQVTLATALLSLGVTICYATGNLLIGVIIALLIGILDGLDGKLARLKEQTTTIGKAEHALDYLLEMSWWAALAFHFQSTGQVAYAHWIWLAFFISDIVDRLAKWSVERRFGRTLDDLSRFDRLIRYVAGRRNIYIWLFAASVLIGRPAAGFLLLCGWGIASTAIHVFRAFQARLSPNPAEPGQLLRP